MKQQLLDLIEHTVIACGVEHVRICAEEPVHIRSCRPDKQVLIYGFYDVPPASSYGISNNKELYSLLTNPNLSLVNQNKIFLTFENAKTGNSVAYSFLSKKRIADLLPRTTPTLSFDAVASVPVERRNTIAC